MPTVMPLDADGHAIPALRMKPSGAHSITVTASSARNATPFPESTKIVSLYATGPVFLAFGDASVTATTSDHYFPEGVYDNVAIGTGKTGHYTHVAAIRAAADCKLYVSEKE